MRQFAISLLIAVVCLSSCVTTKKPSKCASAMICENSNRISQIAMQAKDSFSLKDQFLGEVTFALSSCNVSVNVNYLNKYSEYDGFDVGCEIIVKWNEMPQTGLDYREHISRFIFSISDNYKLYVLHNNKTYQMLKLKSYFVFFEEGGKMKIVLHGNGGNLYWESKVLTGSIIIKLNENSYLAENNIEIGILD